MTDDNLTTCPACGKTLEYPWTVCNCRTGEYGGVRVQCVKCLQWWPPDQVYYDKPNGGCICGNCQYWYHTVQKEGVDNLTLNTGVSSRSLATLQKHKTRIEVQLRAALLYSPVKNVLNTYFDIIDEIVKIKGGKN